MERGAPWGVGKVHRGGLLAIVSCTKWDTVVADAGVIAARGVILRAQCWSLGRGTFASPRLVPVWVRFVRVPLWLCDATIVGFLSASFGRVEVGIVNLLLEEWAITVEALILASSHLDVTSLVTFAVRDASFVVRAALSSGRRCRGR